MTDLRVWGNHVITLTRETFRVWWRLLPILLGIWVLGWLGYQVAMISAAAISDKQPWLALIALSLGFVSLLSAMIICLRFLGAELGIRDQLPEESIEDDRDTSVPRLLALTLLPFLGIYAAFGRVQATANEVIAYEIITRGVLETSVMAKLSPRTTRDVLLIAGVVVACYLLRRVIDAVHEATGFRPLGLLAALVEGFLMLLLIFSGVGLARRAWFWLLNVEVSQWVQVLHEGLTTTLGRVHRLLPDLLTSSWEWLWGTLWPLFLAALAEPVLWLAVAALVYGSHVLSFADMWRKGEPLSVHLDAQRTLRGRRAAARQSAANSQLRSTVLRVQELFFGDLDDKYLPTFQSLRLILGGGSVFLGAYVLVYTAFSALSKLIASGLMALFPARDQAFWIAWKQLTDLATEPFTETLRLALLAVAFARALQLFKTTADPSTLAPAPDPEQSAPSDLGLVAPLPPQPGRPA